MGKGCKGGGSKQAANNRSNSMNPNNPAHHASANNRSNQMNPNNPAYQSFRQGPASGGSSGGGGAGASQIGPDVVSGSCERCGKTTSALRREARAEQWLCPSCREGMMNFFEVPEEERE